MDKNINHKTMGKQIAGFVLFALSCLMWLFPIFIRLFDVSTEHMALFITGSLILGELFFILSLFFLGKEFWHNVKRYVSVRWKWALRSFTNK